MKYPSLSVTTCRELLGLTTSRQTAKDLSAADTNRNESSSRNQVKAFRNMLVRGIN